MSGQVRFWRIAAGLLVLPVGLTAAGCGGPAVGSVSGKVSYKGQPLKGGSVTFVPKAGAPQSSPIQEDGSYKVEKVPVGPTTITVETLSVRPIPAATLPGPYSKMPKEGLPGSANAKEDVRDAKRYVPIPPQYGEPATSGRSLDVKAGPQSHDIDLK